MHESQRGTAQINIFFFLVMLILFLGAGSFGYMTFESEALQRTAKITAQAEVKVMEGKLFLYQHLLEDLTATIGEAGQYAGRAGFNYEDYGSPAPLEGVTVPVKVKALVQAIAQKISVPESPPLSQFFGRIESKFTALEGKVATLEGDRNKLNTQISTLSDTLAKEARARQDEATNLNTLVINNTNQYESDLAAKDQQILDQSSDYTKIRQDLSAAKETARTAALASAKKLELISAKNGALVNKFKMVNPPQDPDGSIIDASELTGLAWVNLGARDMLQPGTVFTIGESGSSKIKAMGRVVEVTEATAKLAVYDVVNKFDPVVAGDEIRNDFYSPNMRRTIFLMGRFGYPTPKPQIKKILESYGNKVVDTIGIEVDLVIVGDNPFNEEGSGYISLEDTEEFKKAQTLGIETATLNKVRNFLRQK